MKIIEVAREQKDLLNEGIAYIALWQQATANGKKSWHTEDFFPVDNNKEEPIFDEERKARLAEIAATDSDAILLNGYYHGWIGSMDEPLNATDISIGLKKHYEMHNALVSGYLAEDEPVTHEEQEYNADNITIEIPLGNANSDILRSLLESKATLIAVALGEDGIGELPIEFSENGTVVFEWLRFGTDSKVVAAWSAFLCTAVKFSKNAKRVTAKDKAAENEKFAFRTFMVKLGMNDADNKVNRKILLRNLSGDSAFATPESKAKWQAKHSSKKNKEVAENADAE